MTLRRLACFSLRAQLWRCCQSGMEAHIGKPLKLETLGILEQYMGQ